MSNQTKIEWTDRSVNFFTADRGDRSGWHCRKVSAECAHCYADKMNRWRGTGLGFKLDSTAEVDPRFRRNRLDSLLSSRKLWYVFVNDMTDTFLSILHCPSCGWRVEDEKLFNSTSECPSCGGENLRRFWPSEWIQEALDMMDEAARHGHVIQSLTKRPERMLSEITAWSVRRGERMHRRFWPGFSAGNAELFRQRWRWAADLENVCDGPTWLSFEPAIGSLVGDALMDALGGWRCDFCELTPSELGQVRRPTICPTCSHDRGDAGFLVDAPALRWGVVGGESGQGATDFNVSWAAEAVRCFEEAGRPLFVKQMGARPVIDDHLFSGWPSARLEDGRWRPRLLHSKGGDPAEWPRRLRVRLFPEERYRVRR